MGTRVLRTEREGFTIVEFLIALMLLSFVVLGVQATAGSYVGLISNVDQRTVAAQLAEDRLSEIQSNYQYDALETQFAGVDTTVGTGREAMTRTTTIQRTRTGTDAGVLDFKRITVRVTGPAIDTIARSVTVAAP